MGWRWPATARRLTESGTFSWLLSGQGQSLGEKWQEMAAFHVIFGRLWVLLEKYATRLDVQCNDKGIDWRLLRRRRRVFAE